MYELVAKLLLAHILGDFLLQPNKWVTEKNNSANTIKYLLYHTGVHLLLLLLILGFNIKEYWTGIVIITASHFCIDYLKVKFSTRYNHIALFIIDQILHIAILLAVSQYYQPIIFLFQDFWSFNNIVLITAILLLTQVSAIIIKICLIKWKIVARGEHPNIGKYIGMLERLFIFYFIINNHWEGVGFLLTAKSIFRFGDLNNAKDRNLTEYVLIGTFISFGLAILISHCYQQIIT